MPIRSLSIILGTGIALALASCETPRAASHSGHDHSDHSVEPSPAVASNSRAKVKPYPLDVCLVSDEDLDSMGGPITKSYKGQEIKFCCKGCVTDFDEDPEKYLAKLK